MIQAAILLFFTLESRKIGSPSVGDRILPFFTPESGKIGSHSAILLEEGYIGSHPAILYPRVRKNMQPFSWRQDTQAAILPFFNPQSGNNGQPLCLRYEGQAAILPFFTPESGNIGSHSWRYREPPCHSLPQSQKKQAAFLLDIGSIGSHSIGDRNHRQPSCHSLRQSQEKQAAILLEIGRIGSHPAILYLRVRKISSHYVGDRIHQPSCHSLLQRQ